MEKKPLQKARVKSKEQSRQQFLRAVGKILKTQGYTALKVNDIAATAGLDKKLIYRYFGGTEGLIDEYIRSLDFWSNIGDGYVPAAIPDGGRELSRQMLAGQFDAVAGNKELQKVLLWGLAEKRKSLKRVADGREASGEILLAAITDPHFGEKAGSFRAIMALMVSGIYYLNMYAGKNAKTFCGIDLTTREGKDQVRQALDTLVDLVYDGL